MMDTQKIAPPPIPTWDSYYKRDYRKLTLEQASKLHPLRQIWYKKNKGIETHLHRTFKLEDVNKTFRKFGNLDEAQAKRLPMEVFQVLRAFSNEIYFVPKAPIIGRSNGKIGAVIRQLCELIHSLEELDRFDTNRIAAQMVRVFARERNARYFAVTLGLAARMVDRAESLPTAIKSLAEMRPSHDAMVQPDLLDEKDWHLGFMYLLELLSGLMGSVVEQESRAGSPFTERDITLVALKRLHDIYSDINQKKPVGRLRLAHLAKVLLYPLMPQSYKPDPLTLARVVLDQVRQAGGKRVREQVAVGVGVLGGRGRGRRGGRRNRCPSTSSPATSSKYPDDRRRCRYEEGRRDRLVVPWR
jgi:hypothetical protein